MLPSLWWLKAAAALRLRSPYFLTLRQLFQQWNYAVVLLLPWQPANGGLCVCTVVRLPRNGRMCVCVHTFTPEHTWLHLSASVSAFRRVPPLVLSTAGGVYVSHAVLCERVQKGSGASGACERSCYANAGASASSAGTRKICIAGQTQLQVEQSTSGNVSRTVLVWTG